MNSAIANRLTLVFSFMGMYFAGVLSVGKILNISLPCGASGGCDTVASHSSSAWFGVPVAYIGFGAYAAMATLALLRTILGMRKPLVAAGLWMSAVGGAIHIVLAIYAFSVIGATCVWCMYSAGAMVALFFCHAALAQSEAGDGKAGAEFRVAIWLSATAILLLVLHGWLLPKSLDSASVIHDIVARIPIPLILVVYAILSRLAQSGVAARTTTMMLAAGSAIVVLGGLGTEGWTMYSNKGAVRVDRKALERISSEELVPADAHGIGNRDASVVVVEFADLYCATCRGGYPEFRDLINRSKGTLRLVYRHFPLASTEGHQFSWASAVFSEYAAEKGKFWDYIDAVNAIPVDELRSLEALRGVLTRMNFDAADADRRRVDTNDAIFKRVYRDFDAAYKLGLEATPTFFVVAPGEKTQVASINTVFDVLGQPRYRKFYHAGAQK